MTTGEQGSRRTQEERRTTTRDALLQAAARGLSRYGYATLNLAQVAAEAGYTRGALYHQFASKEVLALAVVEWVEQSWNAEVGQRALKAGDPLHALLALARGHAVYCRRDVARVLMTLGIEFSGRDHPVGRALDRVYQRLGTACTDRITAGRTSGDIPPGPPATETAQAFLGALQGLTIALSGSTAHDEELAERAVRGVLGLPGSSSHKDSTQ